MLSEGEGAVDASHLPAVRVGPPGGPPEEGNPEMEKFDDEVSLAIPYTPQGEEIPMGSIRYGLTSPRCKRCRECRLIVVDSDSSAEYQQLYHCKNSRVRSGPPAGLPGEYTGL